MGNWIRSNLALAVVICTILAVSAGVIAQQVSDAGVDSHDTDERAHPRLSQMIQKTSATVNTLSATMRLTSQQQNKALDRLEKALDRLDERLDNQ